MAQTIYVFDAYGTLLDVNAAVERHRAAIGPMADTLSTMWRIKQLEYTWTYALMERWRDFASLTADALDTAAEIAGGLPEGLRDKLLAAYETLDAYPDVVPTLRALRARGMRTAILSNGTAGMLESAARAAGIDTLLDAILSSDPLRTYKVRREVYELVRAQFGGAAGDVVFHSSNRWDIAGATAFGFSCVWVNRSKKPDEYRDLPPARVVSSLAEILGP